MKAKVKRLLSAIAAALLLSMMIMGRPVIVYAAVINLDFGDALQNVYVNGESYWIFEGVTVVIDIEKLAETDERVMEVFLEGYEVTEVCAQTRLGSEYKQRYDFSYENGLYSWTVPQDCEGVMDRAYFWVSMSDGSKEYTFTSLHSYYVTKLQDLKDASVTLKTTSYTYDGTLKKPAATVVCGGIR